MHLDRRNAFLPSDLTLAVRGRAVVAVAVEGPLLAVDVAAVAHVGVPRESARGVGAATAAVVVAPLSPNAVAKAASISVSVKTIDEWPFFVVDLQSKAH